ncbi:hypothetical protein H4219_003640 [Mycoemilia scoparia]|uniref:Cytochrome P450 n=1 Tax=Mycoemilia scoparia TaxID=417184 RepID=A0A9W7ZYA4_9FUNG|nr:hypothetical protein H4219_003640 [Mycoemilia scoparia]
MFAIIGYLRSLFIQAAEGDIGSVYSYESIFPSQNAVFSVIASIAGGILVSRVIYNIYFSPLSKYPGSIIDKALEISLVYRFISGPIPLHFLKQHQKYGQYVRVGPNQISIDNIEDCKKILKSHRFTKTMIHNVRVFGEQNTFTTNDPEVNKVRRRLMKPAYTTTHVAKMENAILEAGPMSYKRKIDEAIQNSKDKSSGGVATINYIDWFHYMAFDVIGELAFGQSFDMLQRGDYMMLDGIKAMSVIGIFEIFMPNLSKLKKLVVPWLVKDVDRLMSFAKSVISKRIEQTMLNGGKAVRQDTLQVFIDAVDAEAGKGMNAKQATAELALQLFAGTDTASNTLSWTMFLLMVYPEVYDKVCKEIRATYPDRSKPITYTDGLSKLPYLEAVLYESMRFLPTTAASLTRLVPSSGVELSNGQFLPGGTEVFIPIYSIQHNEKLWKNHHVFNPERFMVNEFNSTEDVETRKKNLFAFSSGVRICPGRNLARCEMFMTLANLLRDYDFWLPEDMPYGPDVIEKKTGQPKIIPAFFGITYSPKNPKKNGWICVKHHNFTSV